MCACFWLGGEEVGRERAVGPRAYFFCTFYGILLIMLLHSSLWMICLNTVQCKNSVITTFLKKPLWQCYIEMKYFLKLP